MSKNIKGKVIIAGAGPGDPELITYKAIIALRKADVVLTDRLVSPAILERFVSAKAQIVFVGKQANSSASASQASINKLLVIYANEGKQVVRLKGGDVTIFSNVVEELKTLNQHGIQYEIIPGITAASGAAAYSGIPLTARSLASSVRFLSYHKQGSFNEAYWKELAQTEDTLVFYMSGEKLNDVIHKLTSYGINPKKLLAIVEQATTPLQNVFVTNLYQPRAELKQRRIVSPSLVVIGKVVGLHRAFAWLQNSGSSAEYFSSLEDKSAEDVIEVKQELLIA